MFVNGVSLGVKEAEDHFFYFEVPNEGETQLVAIAGECKDESVIHKVDTFNNDYRMKEKGEIGINRFPLDFYLGNSVQTGNRCSARTMLQESRSEPSPSHIVAYHIGLQSVPSFRSISILFAY